MAVIPIKEESQATVEEQREEEKIIKVQGGFSLEPQTIAVMIDAFLIIFFLFFYPPNQPVTFPYGISIQPNVLIPLLTVLLIGLIINKSIVNFMEYERGVVFKWGKFNRIAGPGWEVIFPLMERYIKADLRLEVISLPPHEVVTKDKVRFLVSPEIFMYVSNPKDAILNVQNYKKAVIQYVTSALTHTLGDSTSDYIVAHMNEISDMLGHSVEHITNTPGKEWGVVVPRVKLAFIRFPDEVQSAMHKKVASEQLKLAAHEKAEAIKTEIDAIREAGGKLTDPALTYMYLESLDKVAKGKATKIILPLEISKMAENITRRTGSAMGGGREIPAPPEMVQKYAEIVDNYDKRLKDIEGKLTISEAREDKNRMLRDEHRKKQLEDKSAKEETANREKHEETPREKTNTKEEGELKEYKDRIREIKKRVGID
jgi:regulator of protease activity HflC (stomatin/prohibitin superfamily)